MTRRLPNPTEVARDLHDERLAARALASLTAAERAAIACVDFAEAEPGPKMGLPLEVADGIRSRGLRKLTRMIRGHTSR